MRIYWCKGLLSSVSVETPRCPHNSQHCRDTKELTSTPPGVASLLAIIAPSRQLKLPRTIQEDDQLEQFRNHYYAAKKGVLTVTKFLKPCNRQQFEHEGRVFDHLEVSLYAVSKGAHKKAKKSLKKHMFCEQGYFAILLENRCISQHSSPPFCMGSIAEGKKKDGAMKNRVRWPSLM
ncbi:uncharacterized protein [Ptychodera flava]|uniref:uncharacterized protein n=1 Tax=Ptychodera flava TaxID=63121 RepID=UPI00396A8000